MCEGEVARMASAKRNGGWRCRQPPLSHRRHLYLAVPTSAPGSFEGRSVEPKLEPYPSGVRSRPGPRSASPRPFAGAFALRLRHSLRKASRDDRACTEAQTLSLRGRREACAPVSFPAGSPLRAETLAVRRSADQELASLVPAPFGAESRSLGSVRWRDPWPKPRFRLTNRWIGIHWPACSQLPGRNPVLHDDLARPVRRWPCADFRPAKAGQTEDLHPPSACRLFPDRGSGSAGGR
jgi:hypothetical protein